MNVLPNRPELDIYFKRYVWWETPAWAKQHPEIFLANVMNLGTWDDILALRKLLGDDTFREALLEAPAGSFSTRSWDFWHHKLNVPLTDLSTRKDLE